MEEKIIEGSILGLNKLGFEGDEHINLDAISAFKYYDDIGEYRKENRLKTSILFNGASKYKNFNINFNVFKKIYIDYKKKQKREKLILEIKKNNPLMNNSEIKQELKSLTVLLNN